MLLVSSVETSADAHTRLQSKDPPSGSFRAVRWRDG